MCVCFFLNKCFTNLATIHNYRLSAVCTMPKQIHFYAQDCFPATLTLNPKPFPPHASLVTYYFFLIMFFYLLLLKTQH